MNNKLVRPRLSIRMKTFIEHALKGQALWDVCCDHGYVGIAAMRGQCFSEVHFVDQVPHIMERLDQLIKESPYLDLNSLKYTLHCDSGENIDQVVTGTLLIAGVGGTTIKNILDSLDQKKKLQAERILLSPHMDELILLNYLDAFSDKYIITEKVLIEEGRRLRALYILTPATRLL